MPAEDFVAYASALSEDMDPHMAKLVGEKDAAKKAYNDHQKVSRKLQGVYMALDDMHRDVAYREQPPERGWTSSSRKKLINMVYRDKSWPQYTKKKVTGVWPVVPEADVEKAREAMSAYDKTFVRPAGKAYSEAEEAIRTYKKQKTKQRKAANDPAGNAICQVCFNAYSFDRNGMLVKHGWQEVGGRQRHSYGNAYHVGACSGSRQVPFQVDKAIAESTRAFYAATLKTIQALAKAGVRSELEVKVSPKWKAVHHMLKSALDQTAGKSGDQARRDKMLPKAIDLLLRSGEADVKFVTGQLRGWKRDDKWIKNANWRG
jgi:hypothetical protein